MRKPTIGCNTLFEPTEPLDLSAPASLRSLERLAACGYEAVEYSHPYEWSLSEATEIGQAAAQLNLANWSCHAPFLSHEPRPSADACLQSLLGAIALCTALHAGVVVVHTPFDLGLLRPDADLDYSIFRDKDQGVIESVLPAAIDRGVRLALENGHSQRQMDHIMGLVEALDDDHLGICVDTGHAALGDLGPANAIRQAGEQLITTHLQDNLGKRDDHLPPGSGGIDWADLQRALVEVDYGGVLMLELTDSPHGRPYDQAAEQRAGRAFIARWLTSAGDC